ncbi:MAG: NAD(+) synthase [Lachnospiraceae bacterium]|nr:NAD(+) synthase [Lachnospiraceae bacterium]
MKHGFIKTAACSPAIRLADPDYNMEVVKRYADEAILKGAKIIVFPELVMTGATCGDLFFERKLVADAGCRMHRLLKHFAQTGSDALIFLGLPLETGGKLYDVCAVLQGGNILGFVPKTVLNSGGVLHQARHFSAPPAEVTCIRFHGEDIPFGTDLLFDLNDTIRGLMIGCEIGDDLFVADAPHVSHTYAGATLIVNPFAAPARVTGAEYIRDLVRMASAKSVCAYVLAGAGAGESSTDAVFAAPQIIAEAGEVLQCAPSYQKGITYADIDIKHVTHERAMTASFPAACAEEDGYILEPVSMEKTETELKRAFPASPFVPLEKAARNARCEEILTMQALGLQRRMEHIGCKTAVLGISGGLDSTLALLVTVRAFENMGISRKGIRAITMPSFGTTDRTYENACAMVKALGAELKEINIAASVRVHFADIGHDETKHDVTYENSQARERTQILMDYANEVNGLVVGTGDLSELALGWATYNGDHMSMYGVNASIPKTLVRHLVQYEAELCQDEALQKTLFDVVDTPVSPELLPSENGQIAQKTEDIVGPYELHDFFLYYLLRHGFETDKILRIAESAFDGRFSKEEIAKWLDVFYRRFYAQQFKRNCLPDGVGVGSVTLSPRAGFQMPSDASYGKRLSSIAFD